MKLPSHHPGYRSLPGFSMIELLVVVAIISILAVLLFPVGTSMRNRANISRSVANLRSIGVATHLFAAENRGKIPLYGNPEHPTQTLGATVEARTNQNPRALFARDSPLGGHTLSKTSYLTDSMVFHNPRLMNCTPPKNPNFEYSRAPNGRQSIGYYYYSLPSGTDPAGRTPKELFGQTLSNDNLTTAWMRMPIYSDIPDADLSKEYGLSGDEMIVLHLDGAVTVRSHKKTLKQSSVAWKIYYMATGQGQEDPR